MPSEFKIKWESYTSLRKEDDPKVPKINNLDHEKRIMLWAPIFKECMMCTYDAKGPLRYALRADAAVESILTDPLAANSYDGKSGSVTNELEARLPQTGPLYKNENSSVYMKI